ncbi:siderophore-interacting protein [Brachybacterium squillarum]|uniref:siderophore-interacting protein n=1 Tax=Brachybacterium squillarum TaxID=661979 RepID=UPI001111F0C5|nr:siderophore-interacting protein [Brachybacterium squillarum]
MTDAPLHQTPTPTAPAGPPKGKRVQAVLQVESTTRISPRMLRVRLSGPGFAELNRNRHTDAYVKLLIADPATGLEPPYDLEALREERPADLPVRRTYTVRRWDDAQQALELDFVLHAEGGDAGIAAAWAAQAEPGDRIAMAGAGGGYTPAAESTRHLLIGDHAALPAIAAALESMPADAEGLALIHLDHEEDRQELARPAAVELRYVIGDREELLEAVTALEGWEPEDLQVFCHAERGLTKQLRRHLVRERGIAKELISVSAYWALGRIEDQFQAEKREAIGQIED